MVASPGLRRLIVATIAWISAAGAASAQVVGEASATSSPFAAVKARVPVGDVVHVTSSNGGTFRGRLAAISDGQLTVTTNAGTRRVAATDVSRIRWQQPDSPLSGILIGAAVGAFPGVYWLIADPNECTGMCPEEYAFIAIGAVVGGLIDRAITRKVTVYPAGTSSGGSNRLAIAPLVRRDRAGMRVSLRF